VGEGNVAQYAISAAGGLSSLTPAKVGAEAGPLGIAITPDGKSVYLANNGAGTVSQYSVDPLTGKLSPKEPATVSIGAPEEHNPSGVAVTPDGKSAYVTDESEGVVLEYNIDSLTGKLSPKESHFVPAEAGARFIAITPDGKNAYVTNEHAGTVSQYSIEPATGQLSPKEPATVPAELLGTYGIAVSPDGKNAYVTNGGEGSEFDNVSQYSIDPTTGKLSPKEPATVAAGKHPHGIAISPDGKSAYVANHGPEETGKNTGTVSQYSIDPLTGKLSAKEPATVTAGERPAAIAITPDGKSAYVVNEGLIFEREGSVSEYNVDSLTGKLSSKEPATIATGGTGSDGIVLGPFPLAKQGPAPTTLTTSLTGEGKKGEKLTVKEGEGVTDQATLSGENASKAGGKVSYKVYSDNRCATLVKEAGTVTVTSGAVPASESETLSPGTYYWQASYSGDAANEKSLSECGAEVETVLETVPTATCGKTTVGKSSDAFVSNQKRVNACPVSTLAIVSQLTIYLAPTSHSGSQVLKGVFYADSKGKPGTLLGTTNQLTFTSKGAPGWYHLVFEAPLHVSPGNYWIGVITGSRTQVAGERYDSVPKAEDYNTNTYTSGPSKAFGSFNTTNEQMSLYATFTRGD
jgi:DNA-binding beta-propeller fold protein YncE